MNLKDWLELILRLISIVAWPITVLSVGIIFKNQITSLFERVTRAEFPGGIAVELIPDLIRKGEDIESKMIEDAAQRTTEKVVNRSPANERMEKLGLLVSQSGLDLDYYRALVEKNPGIALAGVRMDLEAMLKNLAKEFGVELKNKVQVGQIVERLYSYRAITKNQKDLVDAVLNICNTAIHGATVDKEQAYKVLDMGQTLVDDYVAWLDWGFGS